MKETFTKLVMKILVRRATALRRQIFLFSIPLLPIINSDHKVYKFDKDTSDNNVMMIGSYGREQ
jgi:hypothetical protein